MGKDVEKLHKEMDNAQWKIGIENGKWKMKVFKFFNCPFSIVHFQLSRLFPKTEQDEQDDP